MSDTARFTPTLFAFLREIAAHNDRDWFSANRQRYRDDVQEPALAFIDAFGSSHLPSLSPCFDAVATPQGGSLFRIHRDLRFSTDKTPYKTYVGIRFSHVSGTDAHGLSLYLHLEPRDCWAGVGLWRPAPQVAARLRRAIADQPVRWAELAHGDGFNQLWDLANKDTDRLVRIPSGLAAAAADHPHPDDLRLRSFVASTRLRHKDVTSSDFDNLVARRWEVAMPLARFLADGLGLQL